MSWNGRGGAQDYRNPCITMHQPWASLLVHGIKRVEGRSWPAPLTGRLWIHAAGKVPDPDTIKAMEEFYRNIYVVDGITDIKFPDHYPVSRLLGCVDVVGCVRSEELVCWSEVPESVRLEGLTDFCWLCERPQKLIVPFEMRGYQRVYNLEKKIVESAIRGLRPVNGPLPVKFPLPDPRNTLSLKPGSLFSSSVTSEASTAKKSPTLDAAIAGARAAATQFSKKDQSRNTSFGITCTIENDPASLEEVDKSVNVTTAHPSSVQTGSTISKENNKSPSMHDGLAKSMMFHHSERFAAGPSSSRHDDVGIGKPEMHMDVGSRESKHNSSYVPIHGRSTYSQIRAPSKLFTAAVKEINLR